MEIGNNLKDVIEVIVVVIGIALIAKYTL